MKAGDLVKHKRGLWLALITKVKRVSDYPGGIQHVEILWVDSGDRDCLARSLLLMVSEA
jgi:hypothetical protein